MAPLDFPITLEVDRKNMDYLSSRLAGAYRQDLMPLHRIRIWENVDLTRAAGTRQDNLAAECEQKKILRLPLTARELE